MFSRITAAIAIGLLVTAKAPPDNLTVRTQQGDVVGTQVSPAVRRFLGIPYAVANRWEVPRPPPQRQEPFLATSFGDSCPQTIEPVTLQFFNFAGDDGSLIVESEDWPEREYLDTESWKKAKDGGDGLDVRWRIPRRDEQLFQL